MMKKMAHEISSNQYYGGLNRRFYRRSKLLRGLGFKYQHSEFGAVFVRGRMGGIQRQVVQASMAMNASNRVWVEMVLSEVLRRGSHGM